MSKERIVSVAIMLGDGAFVAPVSNMKWRHWNLINEMVGCGIPTPITGQQGFQTDQRRFVDRREALKIAEAAGQIVSKTGPAGELFSEDMW